MCSVTFHVKSVHALGEGMIDVEVQLPFNAPRPPDEGARVLLCSKSRQADVAAAIAHTAVINESFFNMVGPVQNREEHAGNAARVVTPIGPKEAEHKLGKERPLYHPGTERQAGSARCHCPSR